jgi:phosphatidylserine synthase
MEPNQSPVQSVPEVPSARSDESAGTLRRGLLRIQSQSSSAPQTGSQIFTVPNLVSSFRLGIIPLQFYLAWIGQARVFLILFVAQLLSDALDGLLARWLNQSSHLGARLDSWADLATYMSLPLCAWWLWPELIRREGPFLIAAVASYLVPAAIGFLKFGRLTSYHTWISKSSSVLMAPSLLLLFVGGPGWPFRTATCLFVLSVVEEIAMTAVLPEWHADVPTLWHALKIARAENHPGTTDDNAD